MSGVWLRRYLFDYLHAVGGQLPSPLECVDSITSVRIYDSTEKQHTSLQELLSSEDKLPLSMQKRTEHARDRITQYAQSGKWRLVPGNLYVPSTWRRLDEDPKVYDLVTAKPEGCFVGKQLFHYEDSDADWKESMEDVRRVYASGFLHLLDNAYTHTNPIGGMIATEVPRFIGNRYLDRFTAIIQAETGVRVSTPKSNDPSRRNLKIVRTPNSAPNLRDTVVSHFLAA